MLHSRSQRHAWRLHSWAVRRLAHKSLERAQTSVERRKAAVARRMEKRGDVSVFNLNKEKFVGLTDVTFEVDGRSKERRVSFYFDSSKPGISAYRNFIAKADDLGVRVSSKFTPYHGQSRVSLDWEQFWDMVSKNPTALPFPDHSLPE